MICKEKKIFVRLVEFLKWLHHSHHPSKPLVSRVSLPCIRDTSVDVLFRTMITSLGKDGAGRCAGCLLVCSRGVVSRSTTLPVGAGGGLRSLIVTLP